MKMRLGEFFAQRHAICIELGKRLEARYRTSFISLSLFLLPIRRLI